MRGGHRDRDGRTTDRDSPEPVDDLLGTQVMPSEDEAAPQEKPEPAKPPKPAPKGNRPKATMPPAPIKGKAPGPKPGASILK